MMNNPSEFSMVATGLEFIKHGMRSVETVIDNLFADDTNEIHMLVYSFGDTSLLEPLKKFASKGKIVIVASDIETKIKVKHPDVYEILLELNKERNVTISDFESYWYCSECDRNFHGSTEKENHQNESGHSFAPWVTGFLHAKTIVKNRNEMVVGSANFTKGGMQNYYELGVHIKGIECEEVAAMIDKLAHNSNLTRIMTKNT
tara:strand:- start:1191 stop:1799 length:609 start_codon:yes stop_codon:yes gene_type:complete